MGTVICIPGLAHSIQYSKYHHPIPDNHSYVSLVIVVSKTKQSYCTKKLKCVQSNSQNIRQVVNIFKY